MFPYNKKDVNQAKSSFETNSLDIFTIGKMLTRCLLAGDAPTYVNGQLIAEETVLHHVSE